jgi:hypothetical protein
MTFVLNQLVLAFWNLINSRIDAYRILKHKRIAHGINFAAYAIATGSLIWLFKMALLQAINFCFAALCNRQISFDIPLNLRRKLPWYYQSIANPPKSWWDRVERWLFGIDYDGKKIVMFYSVLFSISLIAELYK